MVDRCVCCGNIIPEGRQLCPNCQAYEENQAVRCPGCGALLEVISSHWYSTCSGHAKNTVFHCNVCSNDWEKDEEYFTGPVKFQRKFWG